MTATLLPTPARSHGELDDDLVHIPRPDNNDLALCGLDISDHEWGDNGITCIVCEGLDR